MYAKIVATQNQFKMGVTQTRVGLKNLTELYEELIENGPGAFSDRLKWFLGFEDTIGHPVGTAMDLFTDRAWSCAYYVAEDKVAGEFSLISYPKTILVWKLNQIFPGTDPFYRLDVSLLPLDAAIDVFGLDDYGWLDFDGKVGWQTLFDHSKKTYSIGLEWDTADALLASKI